jgi:hypothetical protein
MAGMAFGSRADAVPIDISGIFTATTPACGSGSVVCSGVGTAAVSWGVPVAGTVLPSSLLFTPNTGLDVANGDTVVLGTLRLINGTSVTGTYIDGLNLRIDVSGGRSETLDLALTTVNTECTGAPGETADFCADYVYFADATGFGSFRVREGFFGEVQLRGLFGSLTNAGFGAVTGVGFADATTGVIGASIDPSILPPDLQVGFVSPSVTNPGITPVPEPGTLGLLILGSGLVWLSRRRRFSSPAMS